MKVLFLFPGHTHYNTKVLNRLNRKEGLEIFTVAPKNVVNVGLGVETVDDGLEFKNIYLKEKKWWVKYTFEGLDRVLEELKPDIIVPQFEYIFSCTLSTKLQKVIKRNNIKVAYKSIPFYTPKFEVAVDYYMELKGYNKKCFILKPIYRALTKVYIGITKRAFLKADGHLNYFDEAKNIYGSYGVNKDKIFVVQNSVDTDEIFETKALIKNKPPILPINPHRIIHIGRLVEWKRVDLLIEAVKNLVTDLPNIELLIIGKGPLTDELNQTIKDNELEKNVLMLGAIYDSEKLGQYLMESSVYVLAGMGGLSINEAMAFGKPVICSRCDGTEKHLVFDHRNGLYFKEGNLIDLTQKIGYLLNNPDIIEKMSGESEYIIKNDVNVHTVVKRYVNAFNSLTNLKYNI